ncbi:MAG: GGDEF domain-containing protein [Candidatus Nanopelagicales bacterium]
MSIRGVLAWAFAILAALGLVAVGLALALRFPPSGGRVQGDYRLDVTVEVPAGVPISIPIRVPVDVPVDVLAATLLNSLIAVLVVLVVLVAVAPWIIHRRAVRPIRRIGAGLLSVTAFPGQALDPEPRGAAELTEIAEAVELARQALLARDRDIERLTARLAEETTRDPLTRLADRRHGREFLQRELRRSRRNGLPCSTLIIDIDDFRAYNDEWWRAAGDEALAEIAGVISGCVRSTDLVARWGGDEILVVLVDTDRDGAVHVAEGMRSKVRESQQGRARPLTVSIGVATSHPLQDATVEQAYGRAEAALSYAKERGGDRSEFRP